MAIALAVFILVSAGLFASSQVYLRYFRPDAVRIRRRIAAEFGESPEAEGPVLLYRSLDRLDLDGPEKATKADGGPAAANGPRRWLELLLEQARLPLTATQFLLASAGLSLGLGLPAAWFGGLWVGAGAGAAGAAAPWAFADYRRKAWRRKLLKQLPAAFDLMARVIRAGQSVPQALHSVAAAFEDPVAGEFAGCQQQQDLGLRPEVAYRQMVQRSGILELRIFAMAMQIQRQAGGSLSETLERLAGLVRARLRLQQQVRAWTAEGRLQGWTLVALPFLMFGVLLVVNREYVAVLFDRVPLLVGTLACMAVGLLWIRKIVHFDY